MIFRATQGHRKGCYSIVDFWLFVQSRKFSPNSTLVLRVPVLIHDINLNAAIWSLTMVEKYCGLTPFVTWCVFIVSSSRFCCSFDNAKKSFYPTLNAVFCKVGRVASQNVVVELLMFKCVPVQFLYQTHRVQTLSVFRP